MSLEDLGNLGEFLGAIGVIVTLVYLAIQIRQGSEQTALNTTAIHATSFQNLIDHHANLQLHVLTHPELGEVLRKARDLPLEELSGEQVRLHGVFTTQQMRSFYNGFNLLEKGLIDDSQWGVFGTNIQRVVDSHAFPAFWRINRADYPPEFQAMIDNRMGVSK